MSYKGESLVKKIITLVIALYSLQSQANFFDKLNEKLKDINEVKETVERYTGKGNNTDEPSEHKSSENQPAQSQMQESTKANPAPTGTSKNINPYLPIYYDMRPTISSIRDGLSSHWGDYKVYTDSNKAYMPIYVPTYKGLPVININPNRKPEVREGLPKRYKKDPSVYLSLLTFGKLAQYYDAYDVQSYKQNITFKNINPDYTIRNKGKTSSNEKIIYDLYGHLLTLGASLLPPQGYQESFCSKKQKNCLFKGQLQSRGSLVAVPHMRFGGFNGTVFEQRRALEGFVSDHVKPLLSWSKQLDDTFYILNIAYITKYDFNKNAIVVNLPVAYEAHYPQPNNQDMFVPLGARTPGREVHIPMPADKAEALMKSHKYLFFTFKAKVYDMPVHVNKFEFSLPSNLSHITYFETERKVTFFKDRILKNKIYEANL